MMTDDIYTELLNVAKEFVNVNKIVDVIELKGGHINSTYLIKMPQAQYILQQINSDVFVSPFGMMHNICEITDYIRKQVIYDGKDPNRSVMNVVKTRYDQVLCIRNDKYWRCMQYIDNSTAYDHITSPDMFYEVGKVVGEFQSLLQGFHTRVLDETIAHFHDTPYRYKKFIDCIKLNRVDRVKDVQEEIEFINQRSNKFDKITNWLANKEIPRRVTHNDTKPSNVLIDDATGKALCLIDLDTVMKGSLLYDYGDALRIGASKATEDEVDLSKVLIDLGLFESFTKGFLEEVNGIITPKEVEGLYDGFHIITCEIAMRFLHDYIDGDNYFKVQYPTHNLVRARNQMEMVREIEKHESDIKAIINRLLKELDYSEEFYFK